MDHQRAPHDLDAWIDAQAPALLERLDAVVLRVTADTSLELDAELGAAGLAVPAAVVPALAARVGALRSAALPGGTRITVRQRSL
ncbi:MAG TPA: hypothetical protein VE781_07905 [Kineosporiaceae bacterium]|nr:hypothetical protein [Kineosporiaceae bacterium]